MSEKINESNGEHELFKTYGQPWTFEVVVKSSMDFPFIRQKIEKNKGEKNDLDVSKVEKKQRRTREQKPL